MWSSQVYTICKEPLYAQRTVCIVKFKLLNQNVSRPWFVHVGVAEVYTVHRLWRCMVALPHSDVWGMCKVIQAHCYIVC